MKIACWNVNSIRVRAPQVLEWLEATQPDVLALQETKVPNDDFPETEFEALGYQVLVNGQKTYNGVALLAKLPGPPREIITDIPYLDDPQRRVLAATLDDWRLINLYVPNGSQVGSDKYAYKLHWLEKLHAWLKQEATQHDKLVVMGDFNIAPEDRDVHDPAAWEGNVLVSKPEREAFNKLLKTGLVDSFRLFDQPENTFSWWDYRAAAFRRNRGLRIDHILVSNSLAARCKLSTIDRTPRSWERPSDHAPVVASFN